MFNHKESDIQVNRYNPDIKSGLTNEQVEERVLSKLINKTKMIAGKTTWEILRTDVLTFFNILLFVIAGFIIFANLNDGTSDTKWYTGLLFITIL